MSNEVEEYSDELKREQDDELRGSVGKTTVAFFNIEDMGPASKAIVLVIILHVRIQLNWERQYGVPLPWGVWINALPVTIASAIAYSQANMSRTAFVANWLQLHRRWCSQAPQVGNRMTRTHERGAAPLRRPQP